MEHWWNNTDRGKRKYWEKNLSQCHFVHHAPHMDCPGTKPVAPVVIGRGLTASAMARLDY